MIKAIYDDKVNTIIRGLTEGKTREELGQELGYKTYRSLDIYMTRKNWRWNSKIKNYEEDKSKITFEDKLNQVRTMGTSIGKIIELFASGIDDPMEVAKSTGFTSYREMAEHMKKNNYMWNNEKNNYVMKTGKVEDNSSEQNKDVSKEPIEALNGIDINQFLPLLRMLDNNKDKLIDKFNTEQQMLSIPTYLVPGITTVLSASMMSSLKLLVKEYSNEKHITQRQILEVALIEFFNKYGYSHRAKQMLNA